MNFFSYKSIFSLMLSITLSLPLSVFAIDINVSARVPGCGDGVVETGLGEQCEIGNLNGQNCKTQGFQSGILSCTTACTFDTALCSNAAPPHQGGSSSTGRRMVPILPSVYESIPSNNVIFSGRTEPEAWIIVLNNGSYFTSTQANRDGIFVATVSNFPRGLYSFSFYGLSSSRGLFGPEYFSMNLQEGVTTKIFNIILDQRDSVQKDFTQVNTERDTEGVTSTKTLTSPPKTVSDFFEALAQPDLRAHEIPNSLMEQINEFAEGLDQNPPFVQYKEGERGKLITLRDSFASPQKTFLRYPNVFFSFLTSYLLIAAYCINEIGK